MDTTAGFTYAFDCGSGYGAFSATNTASCPTNDNGSRTVKGKIKDKDGGVTEYTESVTINNVAPIATFNGAASVNEGSPISLTLTWPSDPVLGGHHRGFSTSFTAATASAPSAPRAQRDCPTSDNGSRRSRVNIKDKDGGFHDVHGDAVTVNNVAPTIAISGAANVNEGSAYSLTLGAVTDPGTDTVSELHRPLGRRQHDTYAHERRQDAHLRRRRRQPRDHGRPGRRGRHVPRPRRTRSRCTSTTSLRRSRSAARRT